MLLASSGGPHEVLEVAPRSLNSFRAPRFELRGAQQVNIVVAVIGVLVGALFLGCVVSFARERNGWRSVQLFGSFCLVVVVLTHVAEAFHLLPGMGWGLPNTPGHYLDLSSEDRRQQMLVVREKWGRAQGVRISSCAEMILACDWLIAPAARSGEVAPESAQ
jgi:hypothetical protein